MPYTLRLSAGLFLFCLGCGAATIEQPKPANTPVAEIKPATTEVAVVEKPAEKPSASPVEKPPETIAPIQPTSVAEPVKPVVPATHAEAASVIDLRTFPLPEKALFPQRTLANLSYNLESKVADAFKSIQEKLLAQKWTALPDSYQSEQYSSATFSRDSYKLSLSVMELTGKDQVGQVRVSLMNHGNLNLSQMPVPAGAKLMYPGPVSAMYVTDASVDDTLAAMKKLLTDDQWLPYGTAGDVYDFKRNAVRLSVRVLSPPAQPGKTMIDLSSILLAVDIPLPPDAVGVQYSDTPAQLGFDLKGDQYETVAKFYRQALAKQNWEATTDNLVKIDWKEFLIFRNPQKDLMEVELTKIKDEDLTRVMVRFKTAEEMAEEERRFAEEKKRREEAANRPKPTLALTLPAKATNVEVSKSRLEFNVEAGQGKLTLSDLRKQLLAKGWKVDKTTLTDNFGSISFTQDKASLEMSYVETGILPTDVTISSFDLTLEVAK